TSIMNYFRVVSSPKKFNKNIEETTLKYLRIFLTNKEIKNLCLVIHFTKPKKRSYASCSFLRKHKNKKHFSLNFNNNLTYKQFVKYLIHELTHVKQYVREELIDINTKHCIWHNKVLNYKKLSVEEQPWEVEAIY